ncbi:NADH-quinone oxidoreductase subunit C [Thermococcus thioreducens]|uniref:Hydrogenase n=2 Tax=Thermococcus thioreducens TaxID=277988 RepID=A0A1I0QCJ9_9EURY|nr:NADH-quinone oxidoreductase subunit C [Thermococcus thioreducens]ASJ13438.1 hydrogenase [Thermococcus thioreducens]SEW24531.1 membrane-bound hydrogenase subunit beta [Thermococcus thioreducens]
MKEPMSVEEVLKKLQEALGEALLSHEVREYTMGVKRKRTYRELWITIKPDAFRKTVEAIFALDYPHLHFIAGEDGGGETITMIYSFGVFHTHPWGELSITVKFDLPKENLVLPTITDLMIGAETNEREIREMLGVEFEGLKNKRHLFLPDDWPEGKYPWRRDEHGVEDMVKHTHRSVNEIRKMRGEE